MKVSDLMAGPSWKRGFFTPKSEGKHVTKALPQVKEERTLKIHCPLVKKHKPSFNRMYLQAR